MLDRKPSCFFIFTGKNGYSGYLKVHLGFKKNATIMDAKKPLVWDSLGIGYISPVWQNNEYMIVMRMLYISISRSTIWLFNSSPWKITIYNS